MAGYVKSTRHKDQPRPLLEVYNNVIQELDALEKGGHKDYKERILGKNVVASAPRSYWDMAIIKELGISISEWESYSDDDRARYVAYQYIKSMYDVIETHYREQESEWENRAKSKKK